MNSRQLINKKDLILIIIILLLAISAYFIYSFITDTSNNVQAEVVLDHEVIYSFALNEDRTFTLDQIPSISFEINDKAVRFIQSDCPDKVCVNTGYISHSGQIAVCLPNKVTLRIVPVSDTNSFDAVI